MSQNFLSILYFAQCYILVLLIGRIWHFVLQVTVKSANKRKLMRIQKKEINFQSHFLFLIFVIFFFIFSSFSFVLCVCWGNNNSPREEKNSLKNCFHYNCTQHTVIQLGSSNQTVLMYIAFNMATIVQAGIRSIAFLSFFVVVFICQFQFLVKHTYFFIKIKFLLPTFVLNAFWHFCHFTCTASA